MRFKIERDNGEMVTVDPMSSGLADKLFTELNPEELAVLGLFMVGLTSAYHVVAHKMHDKHHADKEARVRDILRTAFTPEQAEEVLKVQPPYPHPSYDAGYDSNGEPYKSTTGMYL